jgi:uncharacterized protein YjbI with pentapeptide repeats
MKTTIKINTLAGGVFFEHEMDGNSIKETVKAMLAKFAGQWMNNVDLSGQDLSGIDFSNSTFYNSKFYNSKFDNSTFYNSKFYNSTFYKSTFDNSTFYNSTFYNSKFYKSTFDNSTFDNSTFYNSKFYNSKFYKSTFDNSTFYNSKFYNSTFDNSTFDNSTFYKSTARSAVESGALDSIKMDFFGRMLLAQHEIPALRQAIVDGKVSGSSYEGECCCFVGTVAKIAGCHYNSLPRLKPDSNSDTEKWFYGIQKGYTPENNEIARITVAWIDEFLLLTDNRVHSPRKTKATGKAGK